jgi:predicted esterase
MNETSERIFSDQLEQIYQMLEQEQAGFQETSTDPQEIRQIFFWRMSLAAVLGRPAESLSIFREALERDYWFSPRWLDREENLATMRQIPEFQDMVEVCRQRFADLEHQMHPQLFIEQPVRSAAALPLLIGLHGNKGDGPYTLAKWSDLATDGWLVAVPQSTQVLSPGLSDRIWDDRERGISEIVDHLTTLQHTYTLDTDHIVLGGYSMGGGLAVWMALHQVINARGFISLGPAMMPGELEALPALLEQQRPMNLRGYFIVGDEDAMCLQASRSILEIMQTYGLAGELRVVPHMDHGYPPNFMDLVRDGLAYIEQGDDHT